jgi:hypothetical protein
LNPNPTDTTPKILTEEEKPVAEQTDLKLAFLDTSVFDDGAVIRGAALVTDSETRPLEFRCTSSIKPTSLQRVLYGNTLDEYVLVELISVPVMKVAKEKPNLILVRNALFLQARPLLQYPVVLISRDSKTALAPDTSDALKPIVISSHRDFSAEASTARQMLATLMQKRDLLEPFERVRIALAEAHKQKIGDSSSGGARG